MQLQFSGFETHPKLCDPTIWNVVTLLINMKCWIKDVCFVIGKVFIITNQSICKNDFFVPFMHVACIKLKFVIHLVFQFVVPNIFEI